MPESTVDVLLIGGGVASAAAAGELRRRGFEGTITLATRELDAPYHRPPITKGLLRAPADAAELAVHPAAWWQEHDVELLTRSAVMSLDPESRTATLANKTVLHYGKALLATGAMVRRLSIEGAALQGIHYLRTPANAVKLREEAAQAEGIVLVGGSFIAVEVAAQLSSLGHRCTIVMQEGQCLERTFGDAVATYVTALLARNGVEIVCGVDVAAFVGDERVRGVRTVDGTIVEGDLVVVGAGAVPDTKLAARAGLELGATGGVKTDKYLRTSSPDIYAAGDVCEYDSVVHGRALRVEHEQHAEAQGETVARNILGDEVPHTEVPYFWTEIADWAKLEYVGPAPRWDREIVSGSVEDGDFTVWYLAEERLVAALTAGRPQDLDTARKQIAAAEPVAPDFFAPRAQEAPSTAAPW
jgi:3-phenylpropionate/trans-cinnamate dioxygenase ferredoxin reductase component